MALTVEELQIVLSCDATTAQQVLDKMDATVKAYTEKFQKYFQTKTGNVKPLDAVAKNVDSAADRIEGAAKRAKKAYKDFTKYYTPSGKNYIESESWDRWERMKGGKSGHPSGVRMVNEDATAGQQPLASQWLGKAKEEAVAFGRAVREQVAPIGSKISESFQSVGPKVKAFFNEIGLMAKFAGGIVGTALRGGAQVGVGALKLAKNTITGLIGAASRFGSAIKKAFSHTLLGKFLKRLGTVMMRMAAMKLIRGTIEGVKQGLEELAKTSASSAKAMNTIQAAGGSIKLALGTAVMPIVKALAPMFVYLAGVINSACDAIARFFAVLTGQGTYTATKFSDSLDGVSSSAGGAGKAVKRAIAAFDELNVIGNQSGGGGGGGGVTSSLSSVVDDVPAFSELATKIREQIEQGNWRGVGEVVANKLNEGIRDWDAADSAQKLSEKLTNVLDVAIGFVENFDSRALGRKVAEWFENIDWSGIISRMSELAGALIGSITAFFVGLFEGAWENVKSWFREYSFDEDGNFIVSGFLQGIADALSNVYNWIKDNIVLPFINGFKKAFGINSPAKEMEEPGSMVGEGILAGIAKPFKAIGTWLNDHIVQPIKDFFTNNREAWDNTEIPFAEPLTNFTDMLQSAAQKFTAFADIIEATLGLGSEYISAFFITLLDYISTRGDLIKLNVQKFVLNLKATVLEGLAGLVDSLANGAVGRLLDLIGVDLGGAAQSLRDKAAQARDSVGEIDTKIADAQEKARQGFNISANVDSSKVDAYKQTLNRGLSATVTLSCNADALKTAMRNALTTTVRVTYRNSSGGTSNAGTISSTPSLAAANGAIAYGMTTALIGEYGGAKSNPEVVAPLSTLVGLLNKSDIGGADSKATAEQNRLLEEQNRLLRIIAQKELKISPSAELGQVVSRSSQLYART